MPPSQGRYSEDYLLYCEILGVELNASATEIRRAFRRLALQYHPDLNKSPDAEDQFKRIYEAYQALSEIAKLEYETPEHGDKCDLCMGAGEFMSHWTTELGGKGLRCFQCLGSGIKKPPSGRIKHTPLNCTCVDCNREWAEWKRRSRQYEPQRSARVTAEAQKVIEKFLADEAITEAEEVIGENIASQSKYERPRQVEDAPRTSANPANLKSKPSNTPKQRPQRPASRPDTSAQHDHSGQVTAQAEEDTSGEYVARRPKARRRKALRWLVPLAMLLSVGALVLVGNEEMAN